MASGQIPDEVRRFILTSIPSVPHLEALLLLRNEAVAWDAGALARRLYMSDKVASGLLEELRDAGMLACEQEEPPRFRYAPRADDLRAMVDRLAETYSRHLVDVTNLIHSKTGKRAQHFADAFKWRKDS